MTLNCNCGAVTLEVTRKPDFIHECNCTLCASAAARWGYYHPSEVEVGGASAGYRRTDKAAAFAEVHACPICATTTHFVMTDDAIALHGNTMMGVNMWLADRAELAGVEVRYLDGFGWSGEGAWEYVREATVL